MSQPYVPPAPPGPHGAPQFRPPGYPPAPSPYGSPPAPTPYPASYPAPYTAQHPAPAIPRPMPRPAVVTLAATMAVTASLQWICALSFAWVVATAGAASLETTEADVEGSLFHILNRFHYRMVDGLAWPLYLIPLVSFFLGFVVLAPRPWARWGLTLVGLVALGWSAWWLRHDLIWWLPAALYVIVACLVLWTPGATAWYRARGRPVG